MSPNAASIVFSDAHDGGLYLLMTSTGDVQPLLVDAQFKWHPAFNKDGTWLAFTTNWDNNGIYLLRLKDKREIAMSFYDAGSLGWAS